MAFFDFITAEESTVQLSEQILETKAAINEEIPSANR